VLRPIRNWLRRTHKSVQSRHARDTVSSYVGDDRLHLWLGKRHPVLACFTGLSLITLAWLARDYPTHGGMRGSCWSDSCMRESALGTARG
jgi:hypothetical protein